MDVGVAAQFGGFMRGSRILLLLFILSLFSSRPIAAFTMQLEQDGSVIRAWESSTITFDVNDEGCRTRGISSERLSSMIDSAIDLWNSVSTSSLQVKRGKSVSTTFAQIQAQTTRGNPLILCDTQLSTSLAPAGGVFNSDNIPAVTQILRVDTDGRIALAVIAINAEAGKSASVEKVIDRGVLLQTVFAHEMGHALGLGHTQDRNALMYYQADVKTELNLSWDDWNGITYLYPRNELGRDLPLGCATLSNSSGTQGKGGAALTLAFVALLWFAVRYGLGVYKH